MNDKSLPHDDAAGREDDELGAILGSIDSGASPPDEERLAALRAKSLEIFDEGANKPQSAANNSSESLASFHQSSAGEHLPPIESPTASADHSTRSSLDPQSSAHVG